MGNREIQRLKARLEKLEKLPAIHSEKSIMEMLEEKGISRRDFMKWAGGMTSMLALSSAYTPLVAKAAELSNRLPVIWLNMAECTGCSESLTRSEFPTIDALIFDYISLEYHETLMAASGWQAEKSLHDAMKQFAGQYILMLEGGIPFSNDGKFLTIGPYAHTGKQIAKEAADAAAAVFAIGTCSSFGGVQAAYPNPTNARPLSDATSKPVINVPGCPPSERNIVGTLMYFVLFGQLPALDSYNRPTWAYGNRIHDLCERRGRFDAGEFVESFGDEGAKKGYCLYKVGCKGPYTFNNCSVSKFNSGTSWPIQAGHGCIGCSEPNFWDTMAPYEKPMADRKFHSVFGGLGADATADKIGLVALTLTAIGIAAHATIMKIRDSRGE